MKQTSAKHCKHFIVNFATNNVCVFVKEKSLCVEITWVYSHDDKHGFN